MLVPCLVSCPHGTSFFKSLLTVSLDAISVLLKTALHTKSGMCLPISEPLQPSFILVYTVAAVFCWCVGTGAGGLCEG